MYQSEAAFCHSALSRAILFGCMAIANGIQTDHGAISVSRGVLETDIGNLSYKLYVPDNATAQTSAPGVLMLHGYQNDSETCAAYSIELARRGVVVMALDEYGHGASDVGLLKRGYVNHVVKVTLLLAGASYPFMTQLGHALFPFPESVFRMTIGNGFLCWYREKYVLSVILKGTAAILFCVVGAIAMSMASANQSFAKLIVFGLCFGALGDILLNLRFVFPANGQRIFLMGVVAFLTGHILYLCAIIPLCQDLLLCMVVGAILAAALLTWIFKVLTVKPILKVFGVLYLSAIVLMTTVSIGNVIADPRTATWLYAAGGVLFTLSDIVLIFYTFGKEQKFSMRITNLILYYLGQLLIAFSLFYV